MAGPMLMVPVYGEIEIPEGINTLDKFREWYHSGVLPEKLPVHFLNGRVWVDFFMEEFLSHNQVKSAIGISLGGLIRGKKLGYYVPDGMLITNDEAGLGTEPDAMFVSHETMKSGRVRLTAGKTRGAKATEMVGTPDLVIEIVSPSSEDKDFEWLMSNYHNAGVPEYWLIDARGNDIAFDIFKHGKKGYLTTRKVGGWLKSDVLGHAFRLKREADELGVQVYTLDVR
jgi:Uma2 family endonuclease